MLLLGQYNTLTAYRRTPQGIYFADNDQNEVLLPNQYIPENFQVGQELSVFLYKDSEGRPIATTLKPLVELNRYALLRAKNITIQGAFFDWGLEGKFYVVYMYLDEASQRLTGTTKISATLQKNISDMQVGQEVNIIPYEETDIGYLVVVEHKYSGMIYKNEVFTKIVLGRELTAYIKKIREDNKIDLSLNKFGYRAVDENVKRLVDVLERNNGMLDLNDKSDPERIAKLLGMSKKVFKKSVGALYKQKRLIFTEDGIKLLK
jgi:predicted RNA-binding protein (virulence factor B family)